MKIAIIRFSALGDIAAALPVFRACREDITIITSPLGKALLSDEFEHFIILKDKSIQSQYQLLRKIWRQFDMIIDCQSNDRSRLLSRLSLCPFVNSKSVNLQQSVTHIFNDIAQQTPYFNPLDSGFVPSEKTYIVLNVGSSPAWISKRLPLHKWQAFSEILYDRFELKFLLTGSADELSYIQTVANNLAGNCEIVAGKTDIQALKTILTDAYLTISTDSGPMHLSAVQKTPTIGLFGVTNWIRSAPYGKWSTVLFDKTCYPDNQPPKINIRQVGQYYNHIDLQQGLAKISQYLV